MKFVCKYLNCHRDITVAFEYTNKTTAEIEIPFPSEEERCVSVEYNFGNTEISMTATEELYGTKCEATYKLI
jgi:hypothetical protein